MDKIYQMLLLQQKLNDATGGIGWENGYTNKGKRIDWNRCIYLEAAELIDSYPWKHWKNIDASPDYENIKIEIVDIWHFVMSEALRVYKTGNIGEIKDLAQAMLQLEAYDYFAGDNKPEKELDIYEQMEQVENMVAVLFARTGVLNLVNAFFKMSANLNLKLNELYALYVGKNVLNQFRQDHGYKEGKYIKEWDGVEDNVVMQAVLNEYSGLSPEELYRKLEEKYPN
jgi:dimeric dUTPase (all-alpha-NTP-PPase superfamily)